MSEWMAEAERHQPVIVWHDLSSDEYVVADHDTPPIGSSWVYALGDDDGPFIERRILDPTDRRWAMWKRSRQTPPKDVFAGEQLPAPPPLLVPPKPPPPTPARHLWPRRRTHGTITR
jgi:hypothetical protein